MIEKIVSQQQTEETVKLPKRPFKRLKRNPLNALRLTFRDDGPPTSLNISRAVSLMPNENDPSKPIGGKRTSQSSILDSYMRTATIFKSGQHSYDESPADINALYHQYEM